MGQIVQLSANITTFIEQQDNITSCTTITCQPRMICWHLNQDVGDKKDVNNLNR